MTDQVRDNADAVLWLTERDVIDLVSLNDAIEALSQGLLLDGKGEAANVDKALGTWNGTSSMHALGSMMPRKGYIGFKTWANTPKGATAIFSLFAAENGQLLAMMEAGALGQMRTAGISGLATLALADPLADDMALIGTGAQALMQVAAIAATRRLKRLRVFSPSPDNRSAFVSRARAAFQFDVIDCGSLDDAVRGASIVTLITRAKSPFISAALIAAGAHLNAAGAILPGNAEFHQDVFERASLIVVDSLPNARKASTEFIERFGTDGAGWEGVNTLGSVLANKISRPEGTDITLFKPMGMGLSDLSVALIAYERARASGVGVPLARAQRATPKWTALT